MKVAVTGARSYSGKYITRALLERGAQVVNLTGHPERADPFSGQVPTLPLDFARPTELAGALVGCDVLVNTYWIRFDHGHNTQEAAVENTSRLIGAAARAGVRRVVHISITNPSLNSALPYFRGKAANEQIVMSSNMSYAILRPTVLFGKEDVLINNIAYLLRRLPVFMIAGDGSYRLQPIFVGDLAALAVDAAYADRDFVADAVGPETYAYRDLVQLVARALGRRPWLISTPPGLLLLAARMIGVAFSDVILTRHELQGLMANLLISHQPPLGETRFSAWLLENKETLGREYASELARHYAPGRNASPPRDR